MKNLITLTFFLLVEICSAVSVSQTYFTQADIDNQRIIFGRYDTFQKELEAGTNGVAALSGSNLWGNAVFAADTGIGPEEYGYCFVIGNDSGGSYLDMVFGSKVDGYTGSRQLNKIVIYTGLSQDRMNSDFYFQIIPYSNWNAPYNLEHVQNISVPSEFGTQIIVSDIDNQPDIYGIRIWSNPVNGKAARILEVDIYLEDARVLKADFDDNGIVDFNDLRTMSLNWLLQDCGNVSSISNDCSVNFKDYNLLADDWLNGSAIVDRTTLNGKIMSGYQGWFTTPADGANMGWTHWQKNGVFQPGSCSIDFWPDISEMDPDEKYPTSFQHSDSSTAPVFSSYNTKTVLRHFKWMLDYGIDGAFVQRFIVETLGNPNLNRTDTVLLSCREAANKYGRAYAVMYDLSGLGANQMQDTIDDFKHLVDHFNITKCPSDKAYLFHNGKPVVAVWGVGFKDRDYTLDECETLIDFLKDDPVYGGCTVMLVLPSNWRTLDGDCISDPKLHDIILKSDIVSPWSVGRFGSANESELNNYVNNVWAPDKVLCDSYNKDYLPVVFPGFSWFNLQGWGLNHIPRQGGQFLWRQYYKAINDVGCTMIYQAMFDEVDEGTAIFKCSNNPPIGNSPFLKYDEGDGQQPDHYLWLVGQAGKMLRDELPVSETMPSR